MVFFRFQDIKLEGNCLFQDFMSVIALLMEALSEVEEFLIRGIVYIFDVSGLSATYLQIVPIEKFIKIAKNGERCVVGRHKGFHIVNVPPALKFVFNLGIQHGPPKFRERVKFYSSFDQVDVVSKKSLPLVSFILNN